MSERDDKEVGHGDSNDGSDSSSESYEAKGKSLPEEYKVKLSTELKGKDTKRKRMEDENEERKAERRAANRQSASKSRKRRKLIVEDMQNTLADVYKYNSDLRNTNNELKAKLDAALHENQLLKNQQISFSQNTASAAGSQMMNQNTLRQTVIAPPNVTLGDVRDSITQNSAESNVPVTAAPGSASNAIGVNAGHMNHLISLAQLGVNIQMTLPSHGNVRQTIGQNAALQPPTYTSTLDRQILQQPASIFFGSSPHSGRIDGNNLQAQQLLAAIQAPLASQSSTTDNNAALSLAAQAIAQSMDSSSAKRENSVGQPGNIR